MASKRDEGGALLARLDERVAAHDKPGAVAIALAAVERGEIDIPALYTDVLTPLMVGVGACWQCGETPVWGEHIASSTVRTIVESLYPTVRRLAAGVPANGRSVLLACPPDETHDLGLRMLADRFDLGGWSTHLLGADTPGPEIVAAAEVLGVELVVLSSSTHFHRLRVRTLVDDLHTRLPGVRVVVGGPAFAADSEGFHDDEIMHVEEFFSSAAPPEASE
jgi:MerR family transcriptional regulator, light-induced transcriptional regulator